MDNWFKSKWFVRLLSLIFAVVLYAFVSMEDVNTKQGDTILFPNISQKEDTIEDMPVQVKVDSEKYVVSGVPEFVTVKLEGPPGVLTPTVRQRNFDVFVDLQKYGEGEHTVEVDYANLPSELSIYIEPKQIDVTLEERATEEFDVTVDLINTDKLPAGYEVGTPEISPGKVKITSSKSVIEQIAIVKVFVDVAGINEPIKNREVRVNVYDSQGSEMHARIEPENVIVSVPVDNPSKTVPVSVATTGKLPDDLALVSMTLNIDETKVFATSDVLNQLEEIKTKEIDLSKITKSGKIETELDLPDGVQAPDGGKLEVTVEVEQSKTFENVPISIENQEDGQEVTFIDPEKAEMSITVVGNEKDVSKLKIEDIQLTIDVKDLAEGEHQVPITIEAPENIEVEGEMEQIQIEI